MEVHQGVSGRSGQHNAYRYPASHVYDEKTAEDVAAQICNDFLPLLKALGKFYRD